MIYLILNNKGDGSSTLYQTKDEELWQELSSTDTYNELNNDVLNVKIPGIVELTQDNYREHWSF
jgi:hypothetical protein